MSTLSGLYGFRGSDWDNTGKNLYAVKYDYSLGYDVVYRSIDRGETFKKCNSTYDGQPPSPNYPVTNPSDVYNYAIPLMIPTKLNDDDTDKMLISPMGSQKLYLCNDINQDILDFTSVYTDTDNPGSGGVFNGFAEWIDRKIGKQYLYAGWYAISTGINKANLYNNDGNDGGWQPIMRWEARHIHTVRVNPYNNYLYVVLGEPNLGYDPPPPSGDAAKIMRLDLNNWRTSDWVCVTDTWGTVVWPDPYRGLYFSTLEFIPNSNRVILGEDTDYMKGRIFYFDDDGRNGSDPAKPLPFLPIESFSASNLGEFWLGAVRMGERLYLTSMFLIYTGGVTSTRCVSTMDGINWTLEQVCVTPKARPGENATLGMLTYHPERGRRLIYSLSCADSFYIEMPK